MAKKAKKPTVKKKSVKKTVKTSSKPAAIEPIPRRPIKLPTAWVVTKGVANMLWQNRKLFAGITIIYGLLNLLLVQGLASSGDVHSLKNNLDKLFSGHIGAAGSSLGVFVVLVGSAGNGSSQTAGAYQLFLALITSLAVVWTLRQLYAGTKIRVKDAFYQGMYPLIPFSIVLIIIGLQLIPMAIGASLYSLVVTNGIAANAAEQLLWLAAFIALATASFYMICSSLFALYIVTLPDMTPLKALRSARQLVRKRRLRVFLKIIWLPFVLLIAAGIVMVPVIVWLTPLAQWIFFILTMFALVAAHAYMYALYRELLNE